MRYLGFVGMMLMAIACSKTPPVGPVKGVAAGTDADLEAVRQWLKENTNSGSWEEVRWWPGRDMVEWRDANLKYADDELEDSKRRRRDIKESIEAMEREKRGEKPDSPTERLRVGSLSENRRDAEEQLRRADADITKLVESRPSRVNATPIRLCRLKYRTKNPFGAVSLIDSAFVLADGKARPFTAEDIPKDYEKQRANLALEPLQYFPE